MDQKREPSSLREAVLELARGYNFEEGHALQDEKLALRLFDETARLGLHNLHAQACDLEITPRQLLSYAALLHDIGYWYGYEGHHKQAFKMIMAEPLAGLSPRAQALVAHVARYHRGSIPDPLRHGRFAALSAEDQRLVIQLGAILRFADGLDRTHTNAIQDLLCTLEAGRLVVTLQPGTNDELERQAGQKKARWFEAVFGVEVVLR